MNKYSERAEKMRIQLNNITKDFTDEKALENKELFPSWNKDSFSYSTGMIVYYKDELYKVIQAHTSQADWAPDVAVSLFVKISIEEFPEWTQPAGAHDAYALGDKVTYNNKHWESVVDANIWQPGVYGWQEITE